jgi:hypothetical protein
MDSRAQTIFGVGLLCWRQGRLETALEVATEFSISKERNPKLYSRLKGWPARSVIRPSVTLITGLWMIALLWAVGRSISIW